MMKQTAAIMANASTIIVNVIQDLMLKTIQKIAQVNKGPYIKDFDSTQGGKGQKWAKIADIYYAQMPTWGTEGQKKGTTCQRLLSAPPKLECIILTFYIRVIHITNDQGQVYIV